MSELENRRGKIKGAPAPEVVRWIIQPGIESDLDHAYQCYIALPSVSATVLLVS